ncbi:hypothetical protein AWENTII_003039 [Aspergillus wentii]
MTEKYNQTLRFHIFKDYDDEEDIFYKRLILSLVTGDIAPVEAAIDYDAWIENNAHQQHEERMKSSDPWEFRGAMPNPTGLVTEFFRSLARVFAAFPPYSDGQNRIMEFLEALEGLPKKNLPVYVPHDYPDEPYVMITFWVLGEGMALTEDIRRDAEDHYYDYSDVETPGSDTQIGWRNWQSAISRLTVSGLIDCGFLCALGNILPSYAYYPDLNFRKMGGPKRIAGDLMAAAEWILKPDAGRYVYKQCLKREKTINLPREIWSMENWNEWKVQVDWIARDERFSAEARDIARQMTQAMANIENAA